MAKCLTEFNWTIDKTAAELRLPVAQVQAIVDAGFHVPGVHYDTRAGWYVE